MSPRAYAVALVSLAACRPGSTAVPEARADEPAAACGVAVVELFTSEGCSSCPPADALLADLARAADRPVYALAFHVDYWDELGWPDRFASPDYTARQRDYARALGATDVYTPEMIVGGTEAFTGSDRARALEAIDRALARPAGVRLTMRVRASGPGAVTVEYQATGAPAASVLDVAVVQRAASTDVRAGENAGKTLRHVDVVRAFVAAPLASPSGAVDVPIPASLPRDGADVIAYVQRAAAPGGAGGGGMPVDGAARAPLPPP